MSPSFVRGRVNLFLLLAASCNCGREIYGNQLTLCVPSSPCDAPIFDADAGKCVDALAADGTACDAGLSCQTDTHCSKGTCVGTPVNCDDSNACTQDTCLEGTGCKHTPITCQGDDPCQTYGCNAASGCVETGVLSDGTACQLWWEPCVGDAVCTAGICDSPTADAEVPGQVRWQVQFNAPSDEPPQGPFTIDDGGTSVFEAVPDGGSFWELFAIDACGKVLWNTHTGLLMYDVMQDDSQLVALAEDGSSDDRFLLGLDPATGATLWSVDLGALLAKDGPDAGEPYLTPAEIAESSGNSIVVLVDGLNSVTREVASLSNAGQLAWIQEWPFSSLPNVGFDPNPLVLDANGDAFLVGPNAYRCANDTPPVEMLWGLTPGGQPMLDAALPDETPPGGCQVPSAISLIATSGGLIVQPTYGGEGPALVVAFDGGLASTLPSLSSGDKIGYFSPVQDAEGNLFVPGILSDGGAGVTAFSASGQALWTSPVLTGGSLFLSDDGLLFGSQIGDAGIQSSVAALDTSTGALQWSAAIPLPIQGIPRVALTPSASVLTLSGNAAIAFFAGRHRPSTTAPWSRWGGDNSNRSSAR